MFERSLLVSVANADGQDVVVTAPTAVARAVLHPRSAGMLQHAVVVLVRKFAVSMPTTIGLTR